MKTVNTQRGPRNLRWLSLGLPVPGLLVAPCAWAGVRSVPAIEPGHLLGLAGVATALLLLVAGAMTALARRLRRSQAEMRQMQARFKAASDAALDALYLLSAVRNAHGAVVDFRVDHCNERGARMMGRTRAQMIGRQLAELLPAPHRARLFGQYCQVAESRQPLEGEFFIEFGGTGSFWLHHQVVPAGDGIAMALRDVTEARQREQDMQAAHRALDDSEKRLRGVTDNLPALISYIDSDSRYRLSNAKYQCWLGVDPAGMLGKTVEEALGPEVHAKTRADLARAFAGEHVRAERHGACLGLPGHYLAEYIPDVAQDGSVRGCYAITIDITERHDAELRLKRSERQLTDLMDNLPATVGYFDLAQRCHYANETVFRVMGVARADVPGISLHDALGEANYAQYLPHLPEVLQGRRVRFEGRIPFRGTETHFQAHVVPHLSEGGEPCGFYLISYDITALKQAQQQQAHVEQRLRAITDNLPVLISYINQEERYEFANATFQAWAGLDPAAMLGHTVRELVGPVLYGEREPYMRAALAGQRISFDIQSSALGVARHLQTQYIPDVRPDGGVAGFYGISIDITALKAVERELGLLARFDVLTGLANRFQFSEKLPEALVRCQRSGRALALMFLDIDHFKRINDTLGHAVGDGALKEFARRLRRIVRATDTVARLAGDEFVVILEGLHSEREPQLIAAKILAEVSHPFELDDCRLAVTTSVGIAYTGTGRLSAAELLARADKALYEAKAAGRNKFECAPMAA
jgi:diguanylate cyclase (GGDEF)-like protein/PAS domain S-box-containing protein